LVTVFLILSLRQAEDVIPVAVVGERSFRVKIVTTGTLDAAHSDTICSEVRGDRGKIVFLIEEGSRVNKEDVLIRLDPTCFEEDVRIYTSKVGEAESGVDAWEQVVEWEKSQGEKELKVAEYDARIAELDLKTLEKGDGPIEMARLDTNLIDTKRTFNDSKSYVVDLVNLLDKGFSNITEISQAKAKLEENRKKYEAARLQFTSYRDYIFPAKLESARARVERAKMEIEQTRKSSGFKIGKAMASLRNARGSLAAASSSLDIARKELEKTVIKAPLPGLVVLCEEFRQGEKRKPRVGDTVWPNQPLLYLPDISSMIVFTNVREVDLHKVNKGSEARINVNAYPATTLTGHVESIGILARKRDELRSGEKYFQVTVMIDDTDERLRPGMTARVSIFSDYLEQVLTVPIAALFDDDNKSICFVDIGTSYEAREVLIGVQNEDLVEIKAGLKAGELVCLSPPPENEIIGFAPLEGTGKGVK